MPSLKAAFQPVAFGLLASITLMMAIIHPVLSISPFNILRLLEIAFCIPLAIWISFSWSFAASQKNFSVISLRDRAPVAMLMTLVLISALLSPLPNFALVEACHLGLIAFAITGAVALQRNHNQISIVFFTIAVGSTAIASTQFLIQVALTKTTGVDTPLLDWYQPYSNPRFYAQAVIWCLPLFGVMDQKVAADHPHARGLKRAIWGISITTWALLLWSGSRGALASLIIGYVLIGCYAPREKRGALLKPIAVQAGIGAALWVVINSSLGWDFVNRYRSLSLARYGLTGRDVLIHRSIELVQTHPWFGVGPGQFPLFNTQNYGHSESHPHNFFLQVAVEWGLPAAAIVVLIAFQGIRRILQNLRNQDLIGYSLAISMIAFLVLSFVDGPHIMPLSMIAAIMGLSSLIACTQDSAPPQTSAGRKRYFLAAAALACVAMTMLGILQNPACALYPASAMTSHEFGIGYDNPRLWVQGRIPVDRDCVEVGRYAGAIDHLVHIDLRQNMTPW